MADLCTPATLAPSPRLAALLTHPIQYYSPWLAALAEAAPLTVYYAHAQDAAGQAAAGFARGFDWDVPLLDGYEARFLANVARRPGLSGFSGLDTPEIGPILRRERPDALLLFGWNKKCLVQGWLGALRAGAPVFLRLDSQLGAQPSWAKRAAKRAVYPLALSWAADYLSPGRRTDAYLRAHGAPARRIHRMPHMIDVDRFAAGAARARSAGAAEALRAQWGAAPQDTVFLFTGKLIEKKRPGLLLEAFQRAGLDAARLVFVGDGPLRQNLERAARGDGRIAFAGFANQSELPARYAAADWLVLPSSGAETWGLVVNEAQACGLPAIISAEAGSAPELIEDGRTGLTLNQPCAERLAALLRHAATTPLKGAPAIAEKAAASRFDVGVEAALRAVETRRRARSGRAEGRRDGPRPAPALHERSAKG